MSRFYLCSICGNLIETVDDSGMTPSCCGRNMIDLKSFSTDGTIEKHVPVIEVYNEGDNLKEVKVKVGEYPHPSEPAHFIKWIELVTDKGIYRKKLEPGHEPETEFIIPNREKIICAYSYCNLHGLYRSEEEL